MLFNVVFGLRRTVRPFLVHDFLIPDVQALQLHAVQHVAARRVGGAEVGDPFRVELVVRAYAEPPAATSPSRAPVYFLIQTRHGNVQGGA